MRSHRRGDPLGRRGRARRRSRSAARPPRAAASFPRPRASRAGAGSARRGSGRRRLPSDRGARGRRRPARGSRARRARQPPQTRLRARRACLRTSRSAPCSRARPRRAGCRRSGGGVSNSRPTTRRAWFPTCRSCSRGRRALRGVAARGSRVRPAGGRRAVPRRGRSWQVLRRLVARRLTVRRGGAATPFSTRSTTRRVARSAGHSWRPRRCA